MMDVKVKLKVSRDPRFGYSDLAVACGREPREKRHMANPKSSSWRLLRTPRRIEEWRSLALESVAPTLELRTIGVCAAGRETGRL